MVVRPPGRDLPLRSIRVDERRKFRLQPTEGRVRADPASGNCCNPPARSARRSRHLPETQDSLTVTDFGGVDIGIHQAMRRSYGDATNNRDNGVVEAFGGAPPALDFPAPSPAARARVPTTTPTHGSATGKLRGNRAGVGHASGGRACCWCGDRRGDGTDRPSVALTAQVQDVLQDDPREVSTRPLPERTQPLCERVRSRQCQGFPRNPGRFHPGSGLSPSLDQLGAIEREASFL